jgi:hypothetical protein
MRTFLVCAALAIFFIGMALTAIPVDAQIGLPPTLTPLPTFDYVYDSPEQEQLANSLRDSIWWENAPLVIGTPRPGFVLYIIQMWRWVNDTTGQIAMYGIVLLMVIFMVLRLAHRVRRWGEKSDGASIGSGEVTVNVDNPRRRR